MGITGQIAFRTQFHGDNNNDPKLLRGNYKRGNLVWMKVRRPFAFPYWHTDLRNIGANEER